MRLIQHTSKPCIPGERQNSWLRLPPTSKRKQAYRLKYTFVEAYASSLSRLKGSLTSAHMNIYDLIAHGIWSYIRYPCLDTAYEFLFLPHPSLYLPIYASMYCTRRISYVCIITYMLRYYLAEYMSLETHMYIYIYICIYICIYLYVCMYWCTVCTNVNPLPHTSYHICYRICVQVYIYIYI